MESQIKWKDVAHLYIGCRLIGMQTKRVLENTASVLAHCEWDKTKIMPVLKRHAGNKDSKYSPLQFKDLLSKGYDLFGLIDNLEAFEVALSLFSAVKLYLSNAKYTCSIKTL